MNPGFGPLKGNHQLAVGWFRVILFLIPCLSHQLAKRAPSELHRTALQVSRRRQHSSAWHGFKKLPGVVVQFRIANMATAKRISTNTRRFKIQPSKERQEQTSLTKGVTVSVHPLGFYKTEFLVYSLKTSSQLRIHLKRANKVIFSLTEKVMFNPTVNIGLDGFHQKH